MPIVLQRELSMFARWPLDDIHAAITRATLEWPFAMFSPRAAPETLLPSGRVCEKLVTISRARIHAAALSESSIVSALSPAAARSSFTMLSTSCAIDVLTPP